MADRASRTRRQTRRAGATSVSSASGEGWRTRTRCFGLPQLAALRPEILPQRLMRTAEVKSVQSLLTDSLASSLQGRDSCGSQRLTVFLTQPHCRCALLSAARWTVAPTRTQLKAFFRPLRFLQFHSFSSGEQFPGTGNLSTVAKNIHTSHCLLQSRVRASSEERGRRESGGLCPAPTQPTAATPAQHQHKRRLHSHPWNRDVSAAINIGVSVLQL